MPLKGEAEALARELFETRSKLRAAGRALHDQVGPLLSAAGIRLDLLRADHPQAAPAVEQTILALDEAMERVRTLSRQLNPPPSAHLGLKKALSTLVEAHSESFDGAIRLSYHASAALPDDAIAAVYEAVSAIFARAMADHSASRISLSVRGARNLTVKIESNGRTGWSPAVLAAQARRARPAEVFLECSTKKSTIVSIRYAPRHSPSG